MSAGRSGAAFDSYRTQQDAAGRLRPSTPGPQYGTSYGAQQSAPSYGPSFGQSSGRSYGAPQYVPRQAPPDRSVWYGNQGWAAPSPGWFGGNRSFGVWDGLFLWSMLSNLGRPGAGDWFHNNQNDPGYQQWRQEANRQAADNAELRQKLDDLDRQLASRETAPRNPGALPPDVPADVAKATPQRTPSLAPAEDESGQGGSGHLWLWAVLLGGGGAVGYLAWRRRPLSGASTVSKPATTALGTAGAMLRHKLSGADYNAAKFRVGMTLQLDPTPFILAGGTLTLPQPAGAGQISVAAIGRVEADGTSFVRLYLPDGRTMVQLHLDTAGDPDECRLFGTIDEVTPADPSEWGAWLDPNEGMIGWPDFQTKDGKMFARQWTPGDIRVPPRQFTETIESLQGTRTVNGEVMLYAAPTGAPEPAPPAEYIMVSARQDGSRAWVDISAGIDINALTLQLA